MDSELYSIGTVKLVESMDNVINDQTYPVDTVILNLGTIVRNCVAREEVKEAIEYDKRRGIKTDRPSRVLFESSKEEMMKFVQEITQMLNQSSLAHNPVVITYHANYERCIDPTIYRKPTEGSRVTTLANSIVRSEWIYGKRKQTTVGKVTLVELPLNDRYCPWRYFIEELKHIKNEHRVAMISSHPVDYHIGQMCSRFSVVRSYTGEVVLYKNLGKIVFENDLIPFNIYTHAVFGDKYDVLSSLRGGEKQKILDIAKAEDWILKTKDYIKERFYRLNIRIPTGF